MMDLEALDLLCAMESGKSINAVARQRSISPSTAWRKLGRLEAELGCRLLERNPQNNRLTQAGREVVHKGRSLLLDARNLKEAALQVDRGSRGLIRVALTSGAATKMVTMALDHLSTLPFGVRFVVYESPEPKHPLRDDFDLVFTHLLPQDDALYVQKIHLIEWCLQGNTHYLEQYGMPQRLEDLAQRKIMLHYLPPADPQCLSLWSGEDWDCKPFFASTESRVVQNWMETERGLSWLPWYPELYEGPTQRILGDTIGCHRPIYLVAGLRQKDSPRIKLVKELIDWLTEQTDFGVRETQN